MVVRKGGVIRLKPEAYEEYKKYHAKVWPKILERIEMSNMRNYVIYYSEKLGLLFSHFEYIGSDFEADMAKIAADPETRKWWKIMEEFQEPLEWGGPKPSEGGTGQGGSWWENMEELFFNGWQPVDYDKVDK